MRGKSKVSQSESLKNFAGYGLVSGGSLGGAFSVWAGDDGTRYRIGNRTWQGRFGGASGLGFGTLRTFTEITSLNGVSVDGLETKYNDYNYQKISWDKDE